MSVLQTWRAFLGGRTNLIGGDLEHIEYPEGAFRGPIGSVRIAGDKLIIVTNWVARMPVNEHGLPMGSWTLYKAGPYENQYTLLDGIMSGPQNIGDGRVHFRYAFARVTLFPQGGSKLDRSRVQG